MRGMKQQAVAAALVTAMLGLGTFSFADDALTIAAGNKATINYSLTVEGKKLAEGKTLEYDPGEQQIIPGLAEGLAGLKAGEKKQITVSPDKAFGARDEEKVIKIPKDNLPEGVAVGARLMTPYGPVTVTAMDDNEATLDFNHPLAGKTLIFDVEVVSIVKAQ